MESTNAQFAKISLAIFDEIANKALDLKQLAEREIGNVPGGSSSANDMDPLNVLQVIKKNLGELKAYIRTVSSGDDMASTTFETSEKNSSLNEVQQALVNMKEQFNAKLIYNDDTLNSTALIEKIKTSLTSLP